MMTLLNSNYWSFKWNRKKAWKNSIKL